MIANSSIQTNVSPPQVPTLHANSQMPQIGPDYFGSENDPIITFESFLQVQHFYLTGDITSTDTMNVSTQKL